MNNVVDFPLSMFVRAIDHALAPIERARLARSAHAERDIANLRASHKEHTENGLRLNRQIIQCREAANESFATAERIKEQLSVYGERP